MSYSDDERDFREEMDEQYSDNEYEFPENEYEFAGELQRDNQEPPNLLEQIRSEGALSEQHHMFNQQRRNVYNQGNDIATYGSQNNGRYNMENFIVHVLELDMNNNYARMMDAGERTDYIIDKAVEAINSGSKKEIQFTPQEDNEYKKLKLIYDKLTMDLQKMICGNLNIASCNSLGSTKLIEEAVKKYPDIRFDQGMTFGYKLKAIEDYLENKMKLETKGGRKSKKRRGSSKKRLSKRKTSKKRRYTKRKRY